ncbi:MAG: alanine/ornithine racemase family PLP-dependent enzyme [Sporomusaceae bacterium]|nr:alanine/ornithine racemase family PLP-dependent enzyme [Sporomusaceae bacterium]
MSASLQVDLGKIRLNAATVVERCRERSIAVLGVTKGVTAIAPIVRAVADAGVAGLADSRLENIIEMRDNGVHLPITLLRIPTLSDVHSVIRYTDASVNSELSVIQALADAARNRGRVHQVILMIDVGDRREGVLAENALRAAAAVAAIPGVHLSGIGTNMGCFGGVLPSCDNLGLLVRLTRLIEDRLDRKLDVVSGGGTSSLQLLEQGLLPAGINQLRIGEAIFLGTDTTHQRAVPGLQQDAFCLQAEIIELKDKPSLPEGEIGRDAFGNIPRFIDRGNRRRAIVALGRQDVNIEEIKPLLAGIAVLGASSDHLILDVSDCERDIRVGDGIGFTLTYAGLLSACQSRYIAKVFSGGCND